jgi:pimeloyl-ACP methyl ester carboxylesterase
MNLTIFEYGQNTNPTIIFLHGLGVSSWMWTDQIEALQDNYHLMAVDLPGCGESYQVAWHSFADTAVLLADIIRSRASNGQAHVVGLSLGGYTALQLLADQPEVVLSTIVSGVTIRPFPNQWFYKLLLSVMSQVSHWDLMINANAKMMQLPAEAKPLYRRDSKRLAPQTTKRIYDEVLAFGLPPSLLNSTSPLLAVAGEKEAKLILTSLAEFQAMNTAVTAIAPHAHHGWNGEFPELFTEMIANWIEQKPLPQQLKVQAHVPPNVKVESTL